MAEINALPTATGVDDLDWLVLHRDGRESSQQTRKVSRGNALAGYAKLAGSASFAGALDSAVSISAPAGTFNNLTVTTSVAIGASLEKILTATASVAIGSLAAGASSDVTMSVPNAIAGDVVILNPQVDMPDGLHMRAYVSGPDTVTINVTNASTALISGSSYSMKAVVLRVN